MKYELLQTTDEGIKIYARIDDDGLCRVTCSQDNPDYLEWLADQKPKTKTVIENVEG
jgi:hypothetical protein